MWPPVNEGLAGETMTLVVTQKDTACVSPTPTSRTEYLSHTRARTRACTYCVRAGKSQKRKYAKYLTLL